MLLDRGNLVRRERKNGLKKLADTAPLQSRPNHLHLPGFYLLLLGTVRPRACRAGVLLSTHQDPLHRRRHPSRPRAGDHEGKRRRELQL